MNSPLAQTLLAGAASALLSVVVFQLGLGFFFLLLPTIPLFWVGLSLPSKHVLEAGVFASLILMAVAGPGAAALHWLLLSLPCWYISFESTKRVKLGDYTLWFPIGNAFTLITAFGCGFVLLLSLYYMTQPADLPTLLSTSLQERLAPLSKDLGPEFAEVFSALTHELSFIIIPVTFWMWMLSVLLYAWASNRLLIKAKRAIRPAFFITPFPLQNWLISLLIFSALAVLIGSPALAFAGKICFLMLLFPYFLQGCAMLHFSVMKSPNRMLLLTITYAILFIFMWPVLLFAGYALYQQLISLNKHLSTGGTSSRS